MSRLYVFDLDGTLADLTHRLPHIQKKPKDWDTFSSLCHLDQPIEWIVRLFRMVWLGSGNYDRIIILSARVDTTREKTEAWLDQHITLYYDALLMRKAGDFRPDLEVKPELLNEYLAKNPGLNVEFIVEDRQSVVDAWRLAGYKVLQCDAWKEDRV